MSNRNLAVLGFFALLLGLVASLVFLWNPATDVGLEEGMEENGTGIAVEAGAVREGSGEVAALGKGVGGMDRANIEDEQASYEAAMSGFRGRVVDHEKTPLADRIVRFYRIDPEILQNPGLFEGDDEVAMEVQIHEGRTDAEGRFLITGAWPNTIYILEADAEGDDRLTMPIDRTPGSGEIVDLGDIQLVQLGVIEGRVIDEAGAGVPGALVLAADIPAIVREANVERFDPEGALIIREGDVAFVIEMPAFVKRYYDIILQPRAITASDGTFRLGGVQPRENVVAVRKRELVPIMKTGVKVKAGKVRNIGTIRLKEGEIAFVKVVDTEDEPIAGAEVLIGPVSPIAPVAFATRAGETNAKGTVELAGFPASKVAVAARRSRSHPWVIPEPESVAADIVVRLPAQHHLDLTIKSAVNQEIVAPKFKLMPSPDEGVPLDAGAMGFIKWIDVSKMVKPLDDKGRYRIEDLIPGKYTLAVAAPGHAAAKVDFQIAGNATAEITLRPESAFVVRVVDKEGKAVSRAKVYVLTERADSGQKLLELPIVAGTTDKSGQLRVRDGEAGEVRVSASHPAFGFAHAEVKLPTADPVVLLMDAPGRLQGVLTEGGKIPQPGKWTVVIEPRFRGAQRGAMPDLPKFTVPDLEGKFEARGLRPGNYRLRAMKSLSALTSPGGMIGFMMRSSMLRNIAREDVVVESGQPTFVDLEAIKADEPVDGPSARVSGTVLVNGRPGKGLMLTCRGARRHGVTVDETGRFDLGAVPVGNLRVSVRDTGKADITDLMMEGHLWRRNYKIEDGKDLVLDIHIETGRISGVVVSASGLPVDSVQVRARGEQTTEAKAKKTSRAITTTDSSGRFTFESIPAGVYHLTVKSAKHGFGTSRKLQLLPNGVVVGERLKLAPVCSVSGKVDLTMFGSKPPEWSYVQFENEELDHDEGGNVRKDGSFEVRALPPGRYSVSMMANDKKNGFLELDVTPSVVVVGAENVEGLVLTPRYKSEKKPEPRAKVDRTNKKK